MIGRIPVLDIHPLVDCGRLPAKAVPGETFRVLATVFCEGQGAVGANVVLRDPTGRAGPWTPMHESAPGTDRWAAEVTPDIEGRWTYAVEAWADPVTTWRQTAMIKVPAGLDTELTLAEGAELYERAAAGVPKRAGRAALLDAAGALRDTARPEAARLAPALAPEVTAVLHRYPLRELLTTSRPLALRVERRRALFGSWYEFFPRSEGARPAATGADPAASPGGGSAGTGNGNGNSNRPNGAGPDAAGPGGSGGPVPPVPPLVPGTLRTAAERLPAIAGMGFDVVYLPPIHPIGTTARKGRNDSLRAGPNDVGSPWAIGSADGGHDAVHPELGTLEDFDHFVRRARALDLEVALDFALQCSPDHPWVKEHPQWFRRRADGSIAHAENPPKQYQDIVPLCFDNDFRGLVAETLRVLRFWMARGVRIFRVDNPHTKPVAFWEKVLADIGRSDPDVIFLAEAFTRPAMMRTLAKIGFQQSYTYFTWRTGKQELTDYLTELTGEAAAYMRPNLFVNTPDILHAYLQHGGRPAFEVRAVLAATLSPSWGLYAGYELCENTPLHEGSEEYLDSEKFQLRPRDWAAADRSGTTIRPLITRLNRLRRRHPALQQLRSLHFHRTDNEAVIAYSKRCVHPYPDTVLVVVNLDPHHTHEATVSLDTAELGLTPAQCGGAEPIPVCDELTGDTYHWGRDNYVRLEPGRGYAPAHVFTGLGTGFRGGPAAGGQRTADRHSTLRPHRSDRRVTQR